MGYTYPSAINLMAGWEMPHFPWRFVEKNDA